MTSTEPRFVPFRATFVEPATGLQTTSWGVKDTESNTFAPFGGSRELAEFAAQRIAERPALPWSFLDAFEEAPRFEWVCAHYEEADGHVYTAYGALDRELNRFAAFSNNEHDPDAEGFLASVAANPDTYAYSTTFTLA